MKGELAQGVVPDLLRELYVARRDGTIRFIKGDEEHVLRINHGDIVGVEAGGTGERLDEFLVRQELLSADDAKKATDAVAEGDKALADAILELELMDKSALEDAVAVHVRETLATVFVWDSGEFAFDDGAGSDGGLTLKVSTGELILEAVRAIEDPDIVTHALGDMDRVLQPSQDPLLRFQKLDLTPNDGFVLSRVDGTMSAREIEQLIPLPAEDVRQSLLALVSTGAIEYLGTRRPGPEKQKEASEPAAVPPQPEEQTEQEAPAEEEPEAPSEPEAREPEEKAAPEPEPAPMPEPEPERRTAAEAPAEEEPEAPAEPEAPDAKEEDGPGQWIEDEEAAAAEPEKASEPEAAPAPEPEPAPAPEPEPAPAPEPVYDEATQERRREIEEAFDGLKSRNHFEVLGLERSAKETDVKEAYFRLAKRFHPDVHHDASLADLRDKLEKVFIRLGEAYEVLRSRTKRADYEQVLGRPRTRPQPTGSTTAPPTGEPAAEPAAPAQDHEQAVARAEQLYATASQARSEDPNANTQGFWEAIQIVEPLVEQLGGPLQLRAQMVLARCRMQNPRWIRDAEEILRKTSQAHPKAVDPLLLLGSIYESKNLVARATNMYRKVLEIRPADGKAIRALERLQAGSQQDDGGGDEKPKGGLLKKIFGRK